MVWNDVVCEGQTRPPWFLVFGILLLTGPSGWVVAKYFSEPMNRRLRGAPQLDRSAEEKTVAA